MIDDTIYTALLENDAIFTRPFLTVDDLKSDSGNKNIIADMLSEHSHVNSLLFTYGTEDHTIEYLNGNPIAILKTRIVVNLYDNVTEPCPLISRLILTPHNRRSLEKGIIPADFVGSYFSIPVHKILFRFCPDELRETNCHGDKCRYEIDPGIDGIWCTACHGDLGDFTSNMGMILKQAIRFSDIPKSSIVHIEQTRTEVCDGDKDMKMELDRINERRNARIADLRERIHSSDQRIKDIVDQKKKDEAQLNTLVNSAQIIARK